MKALLPLLPLAIGALTSCSRSESALPAEDTTTAVSSGVATSRDSILNARSDTSALRTLDCGVTGTPVLTDEGIGELKHGRTVAEIAARCEVMSDSEQRGVEGQMERAIMVRVAGEPVRAVVAKDRIHRIEVNTPRFRTTDSLGVDTPLRRIAAMRGVQFAPGEDGVYGFSADHCGLSFRFSLSWRPPAGGQWTAAAITAKHGDAAVNRVIVIECSR